MDSESGVTLLYKAYLDIEVNEDLVSGLLTALNQFSQVELKQPIESIEMSGLRWVYQSDQKSSLLFIAADTKDIDANTLYARLNVIKQTFLQTYELYDNTWRDNWNGNIEKFIPFKETIDEFYQQWKQVAQVQNIAEFYDILLVFQQILNRLMDVIENHFTGDIREKFYLRIEYMFEKYQQHAYIKNNPELQKISFNRHDGFSIIEINPHNCDPIVVEKQIINLINRLIQNIRDLVGHARSVQFFMEESIFTYILSNLNLLKSLNLDHFLLQTFLEP
ncbi:MAG: hypothetical protein ACTSR8_00160 [Promethearchaeota archaeon]